MLREWPDCTIAARRDAITEQLTWEASSSGAGRAVRRAAARSVRASAAANLAAWHDSSTRALGLRPRTGDRWWTCAMPAPNVYYTAISLVPATNRRDRARMNA